MILYSSSAAAMELERALRKYVEARSNYGSDAKRERLLAKVFQDFDYDGSGYLDLDEFEAAMVRMNFVGCQDAVAELFDKYDEDVSGYISYKEFVKHVLGEPMMPKNTLKRTDEGFIVKEFRNRILEKNGVNLGFRGVRRVLKRLDENRNGTLSEGELKQGLDRYGIESTPHEAACLMRYMDKDKNGRVTVEEFFKALQGPMSRVRKTLVKKAWNSFLRKLKLGEEESISLADLSTFYDCSKNPLVMEGQMSEEDALRQFAQGWDKDQDDTVTFKEFLEYYRDLSAGIDDDDYFELMIRNAWHLSGGKGWCENTSNIRVLVTYCNGDQKVVELVDDLGVSRSSSRGRLIKLLEEQGEKDVADVSLYN